jgi:conjugal transfer pilus assembly protein TraF
MKRAKIFLIIMLFAGNLHFVLADSTHCNTLQGWHFYCDAPEDNEKKNDTKEIKEEIKPDEWYVNKLKEIQSTLEIKKTKMVVEPSEANLKDYMAYQQMVLDMSSNVSDRWQRVQWKNPELDYTIKKPVSKIGKETYLDERKKEKQRTLEALSKRYGVFFAFRSDCPFCHKFAPVVKMLEEKGFNIMPISMDGGFLPEFASNKTKMNNGELAKLGIEVNVVPALFLFDAKTNQVVTIGFGFMAFDEVEERIFLLTKDVGEDY